MLSLLTSGSAVSLHAGFQESLLAHFLHLAIMFSNNGLAPVSAAGADWLITLSLEWTFLGAGFVLICLCVLGMFFPVVRQLGLPVTSNPIDDGRGR